METRPLIEQFQALLRGRPSGDESPALPAGGDLPTLIREAQAHVDSAVREREEALRHADLRIARGKQRLAALEAEQARRRDAAAAKDEKPLPRPERPKRKRK
jgi:hypothetical protein